MDIGEVEDVRITTGQAYVWTYKGKNWINEARQVEVQQWLVSSAYLRGFFSKCKSFA